MKVHQLADRGVSRLYREEIVKTILDAGYAVDVFGDRWNNSPYAGNPNLKIHKEIAASEVQEIYKNSKISLNIMTWHKDSITERVLDSMAAGSIVLTDTTPALEECFKKYPSDNAEILLFSLKRIKYSVSTTLYSAPIKALALLISCIIIFLIAESGVH